VPSKIFLTTAETLTLLHTLKTDGRKQPTRSSEEWGFLKEFSIAASCPSRRECVHLCYRHSLHSIYVY